MEIPDLNNNKKKSRSIGIMYKLRRFVNVRIMKSVYYSIIYPHLIYGLQVWVQLFKLSLKNEHYAKESCQNDNF